MATFDITAEIRTTDTKPSTIRKSKRVPGIVYGKKQAPIAFSLDSSDFLRLYRKAGESNIINLKVGKEELEVLVHQTQKHHITGEFTHVDFYAITRGEKLSTHIHFNFSGVSLAKKDGAIIDEHLRGIDVKCLPRNLVDHFDVDLTALKEAGDMIRISDLKLDTEKYEISVHDDDVVVSAVAQKEEIIEDDAPEMDLPEGAEEATDDEAEKEENKK